MCRRGEDRPAGDLRHVGDGERDVAAGFAARGVDEPQVRAVEQQADRNLRFAEQPLELGLRARLPVAVVVGGRPRRDPCRSAETWISISQGLASDLWLRLADGVRRAERLVVFRQRDFQRRRTVARRRDCRPGRCSPAEHVCVNSGKSRISGMRFAVLVARQAGQKPLMLGDDVAVDVRLGAAAGPEWTRPGRPAARSRAIPDERVFRDRVP